MDFATDVSLCPLDGRRSSTEVWVKLFVVYFTTTCSLCHLLSLRREQRWASSLATHILVPLTRLFDLVLWLTAMALFGAYWAASRDPDLGANLARGARLFFGTDQSLEPASYHRVPTLPTRGDLGTRSPEQEEGGWRKALTTAGRLLVLLAFIAQCAASIMMYTRRYRNGTILFSDQLVFELACGGILTAILTAAFLLKVPFCAKPAPAISPEDMTLLDKFIVECLRPKKNRYYDNLWSFRVNITRSLLLLVLFSTLGSVQTFLGHFNDIMVKPSSQLEWRDIFAMISTFLLVCLIPAALGGVLAAVGWSLLALETCINLGACSPLMSLIYKSIFGTAFFVGRLTAMSGIFLCWTFWFEWGIIWVYVWYGINMEDTAHQLRRVAGWPTSQPCPPELWTDPLSSWIWMLA